MKYVLTFLGTMLRNKAKKMKTLLAHPPIRSDLKHKLPEK